MTQSRSTKTQEKIQEFGEESSNKEKNSKSVGKTGILLTQISKSAELSS